MGSETEVEFGGFLNNSKPRKMHNNFYHSIDSCTAFNQTQVQQHGEGEGGYDDAEKIN